MHLSYPQTYEPFYFPGLEILNWKLAQQANFDEKVHKPQSKSQASWTLYAALPIKATDGVEF